MGRGDSHGSALVSVMVAVGLIGMLALFYSNLLNGAMLGAKFVSQMSEWTLMKVDARSLLSNETACLQTLQTLNLAAATEQPIAVKDTTGNPIYSLGMKKSGLHITQLTARRGVPVGNVYPVTITLEATKLKLANQVAGKLVYTDTLHVNLVTSGTVIQKCVYSSTGATTLVDFETFGITPSNSRPGGVVIYRVAPSDILSYPTNDWVLFDDMWKINAIHTYHFTNRKAFTAKGNLLEFQCSVFMNAMGELQQGAVNLHLYQGGTLVSTLGCGTLQAPNTNNTAIVANLTSLLQVVSVTAGLPYSLRVTVVASRSSAAGQGFQLKVTSNPVSVSMKQYLKTN